MENLHLNFGQAVRRIRRKQGLSQERMGELAWIARATIASIELGRQTVALDQAVRICEALKVDLGQLLSGLRTPESEQNDLRSLLDDHDYEIIEELRTDQV